MSCHHFARQNVRLWPILLQKSFGSGRRIGFRHADADVCESTAPLVLYARAIQRVAPAKYWSYVNFVFANQETIGKAGSFDKTLQNFCEDNDIDWSRVEKIYRSQTDRTALLDQVSRSFDVGVASTPTYILNGQMIGYGPSGTFTTSAIKSALGIADAKPPRKLAKKPEKKPAKSQR